MIMRSFFCAAAFVLGAGFGSVLTVETAAAQSGPEARAFGSVDANRFLFKKGFKSLRKNGVGSYCLLLSEKLLPFRELITPSVTVEYGGSSGDNLSAYYAATGCNDGEVGVRTFKFATGGNNLPSDDVAFVIFIP